MKLSRLFLSLLACTAVLFGGCQYDDDDLWDKVNDLDTRLKKIETLNGGIESLWTIVNTLNGNDHISDVKNNTDGSYTITFASGKTATIRDGAKGAQGDPGAAGKDAPVIGVKQHTDGVYYWTTGTDWLLDANDKKIRVTGEQGDEGAQGVTPLMDIDDAGYWTVSYDGGKTYTRLLSDGVPVKAAGDKGDPGDSFFSSVSKDDDFLYLTLAGNDTVLQLPIMHGLSLVVTDFGDPQTFVPGVTQTFEVVAPAGLSVFVISQPEGWKASVAVGILTVTPPAEDADGDLAGVVVLEGYSESLNASTKRVLTVECFTGDVYDYITDPAFLAYVKAQDWDGGDGKLTLEEAAAVTEIVVQEGYEGTKIKSFAGIEYFTGLTELFCDDNELTSLDLSRNTVLEWLECSYNQLTSLDLSRNTALTTLSCTDNRLTSLDFSRNITLDVLYCYRNRLTSLDVSQNTALTGLYCENNQLTSLDISRNTALLALSCGDNQLTSLDLSRNTALRGLYCNANHLSTLDASGMSHPTEYVLFCGIQTSDGTKEQELLLTLRDEQISRWTDALASDEYNKGVTLDVDVYAMIPDAAFLAYVKAQGDWDTDQDGKLSPEEAAAVKEINVINGYDDTQISSLVGIEYFTGLTQLFCNNNQLASLDVSKNTALTRLELQHNQLTSLDVSKNTKLNILFCGGNKLSELDVMQNTSLIILYCNANRMTTFDASGMADPTNYMLRCGWQTSDGTKAQELTLTLRDEQMPLWRDELASNIFNEGVTLAGEGGDDDTDVYTKITDAAFLAYAKAETDWDQNSDGKLSPEEAAEVSYIELNFGYNDTKVSSLAGIEYFTGLTKLECSYNELTSLDVSKNTALTELYCFENQLTSLDVSQNTALTVLDCGDNQLTSLDVSKNTALTVLVCMDTQLTSLDVSKNTALTDLTCGYTQLTSLDLSKNTALTSFGCIKTELTSLDLSNNTALTVLYCDDNSLTSLDLSKNTALTELYAYNAGLTSLDVSGCAELTRLYCDDNSLTSLNVSKNTKLTSLLCHNNNLTSLDISKNTALISLNCYNNRLLTLDASGMADPTGYYLNCGNQTSDGTKAQELTLTLTEQQKERWNANSSNQENNKGVKLAE